MKKIQQLFSNARNGLFGARASKQSPLTLAASAGKTGLSEGAAEQTLMEQLEKREYLFVLTVDAADPTFQPDPNRPHYGTVTLNFAYFLPFLTSELPTIAATTPPADPPLDPTYQGPGVNVAGGQILTRNRMAEWLENRMAGVQVTLYGRFEDDPNTPQVELATSIQVFDLYGRDMQGRLDIGRESPVLGLLDVGGGRNQVDPNDVEAIGDRGSLTGTLTNFNAGGQAANVGDGVPDMNDGLGMIVFIQSDANAAINLAGGRAIRIIDQATFDQSDVVDFNTFYGIDFADDLSGESAWWDDQGFGFGIVPGTNPPNVSGLPDAGGGVLFGAPYIRDNTDRNTYFGVDTNQEVPSQTFAALPANPLVLNFTSQTLNSGPLTIDGVTINTPIVGIRTLRADQAVGTINVPGIFMGTVNISGSLGIFYAQHLLGSIQVTGDVGEIYVGGTSGYWVREDQRGSAGALDNLRGTGSSITIGGRLGNMFVAGRNRASVFVTGDVVNARRRVEGSVYNEREVVFGIDPNTDAAIFASIVTTGPIMAGEGTYRNDGFSTAEFIFSGLSGTTVNGSLGLADPLNDEDLSDFYAFAADAGRTVQINAVFGGNQNPANGWVRIYDQNGNLVATHQAAGSVPSDTTNPAGPPPGVNFSFVAPSTGVYYMVVGTLADGQFNTQMSYTITMAGQAATTLGQIITGGGLSGFTVSVGSGAVGRISGGLGIIGPDGAATTAGDGDPSGIPADDYLDSAGFSFSVPTLYNLLFGDSVGGGLLTASGVVGGIQVGGDLLNFTANLSRQLGSLDVTGQTGVQNVGILARGAGQTGAVVIRTGSTGVPGHIGRLDFGDLVRGDQFTLITSPGSFVDQLTVEQGGFTQQQPTFNLGQGSDIRFASFPSVRLSNPGQQDIDYFLPLLANTPLTLTDDSGVTFTVTVTGTGSFGTLRVTPAGQLGGVIVGRIDVNLAASGNLVIRTTSSGSLALGEINVTGGGNGPGQSSNVQFAGPAEIDVRVLRINGTVSQITNTTPDGDIVSADVGGVTRVVVNGSIGSTRTYVLSQQDIALHVNLQAGLSDIVNSPIGIPNGLINGWQGGTNVPFVWSTANAGERTLEDSGSPIDDILNGIVIRTGDVQLVSARGSIGDVITQGGTGGVGAGRLMSVIANSDRVNTTGRFEGITGSIFAGQIQSLDVGDGVLGPGPTPLAQAGVFAIDDIISLVAGTRVQNPVLTGALFIAGNVNAGNDDSQGITQIRIVGANLDHSFVHVANLDSWWTSVRYNDDRVNPSGAIQNVSVTNGSVIGTDFHALAITSISIIGGVWDSSSAQADLSIGTINADAFTSTLSDRDPLQYMFNQIRAGLDVGTVRVNNQTTGDIEDLFLSAGRNNTTISARNILRSNIDIRGNAGTMNFRGDVRTTSIGSGRLSSMIVGGDIRSSTIRISGAILNLTSQGDITDTEIVSSGPDGRINNLTARGTITGTITSSGPIGSIRTTTGDINVTITTTDSVDGNINSISAGRDLILVLDMADGTTVNSLRATRNIGRRLVDGSTPDALDIPGNVNSIIAGGVLYSDVRAGGTIGTITSGRALAYLPTADYATDAFITASGRITSININGDFNGSIVSYSGGIGSVTITNGSFRAGDDQRPNRIEARDGDISSVRIVRGHLLGDILAPQGSINVVSVTGDAVFGDIGINPDLSTASQTGVNLAERRTQLPVGAVLTTERDGPTIAAGINIGSIVTTGGIFEATITAGRQISTISVGRGIDNAVAAPPSTDDATVIAAGDRINSVSVRQQARGTFVAAGLTDLGDDAQPGGTGTAADTVKSGTIGALSFRGGTDSVTIAAGLVAGVDGLYNTADDNSAPGISTITSVQVIGTATNTHVLTDSGTPNVSANLNAGTNSVGGQTLPVADGFAYGGAIPGANVPLTTAGIIVSIGGQLRRVTFTGAGTATYSATFNNGLGAGTLVLNNSSTGSSLRIEAAPAGSVSIGTLRAIIGRDDASLGSLIASTVDISTLSVMLDGSINAVQARNMTNSAVRTGQSLGNVTAGVVNSNTQLTIESRGTIGSVRTLGGVSNGVTASSIQGLSIGSLIIGGQFQGFVSSDRDITSLMISGQLINGSGVRAGYDIRTVTLGSMATSVVAAGGNITTVRVNGNVADSAILSGVDLGRDASFGGTGANADTVSNGNMGTVTISGSFVRSDISAGGYQGADGFLGTQDDQLGEGRSTMGNVTITGSAQGSLLNTESYRIFSNGTMGTVRSQNVPFTSNQNLTVVRNQAKPDALQVTGVDVQFIGGVYFATIFFNQPVDPGTISGALTISEIRGIEPIATFVPLVEGADYTVSYAAGATAAIVQFSGSVTNRDLDVTDPTNPVPGALASPGMYRFTIDNSIIRGQTDATRLDGDGDGVAETADNWSDDFVVGDAGDRFFSNTAQTADLSNVDFYGPVNLDVIMSANATAVPNAADINRTYNIQGFLGDHPDTNGVFFAQGSDVDVYTITMLAGQVLQAGVSSGSVHIVAWDRGNPADPTDDALIDLTAPGNGVSSPLTDGNLLMLQDVTVFIVVDSQVGVNIGDPHPFLDPAGPGQPPPVIGDPAGGAATVVNLPGNGAVGAYTLSVRIVDDGDNGFGGATDASDGSVVEDAPLPAAFAGVDGILGTQDDLASIAVGEYTYQLDAGTNRVLNGNGSAGHRSDDIVIGVNQYGTEQMRTAGADGVFGTSDDLVTINSAIGERNAVGSTLIAAGDSDVFHLNAGQPIVAGQRYRFTLRVSEYGGDLGTPRSPRPTPGGGVGVTGGDSRGQAQFALFETTIGGGMNAGNLVAQAPNPEAFRGTPNTVIATDGATTYGYDEHGDFYMEITMPPSQADGTQNATFALYVQGAHQSNYSVEVLNVGTGPAAEAQHQNFLIEANGGVVNWLNAFGASTVLDHFTGSVAANVPGLGMTTRAYILSQLINNLNAIFTAAGVDVRISLTSSDFVGEAFSTVFVTDSLEPADVINQNFFGVSERRDVLNANRSDQAVVFAPAVTALGNPVDQAGIDSYITSLTGSVVQRMGELLGLTFAGFDTGAAMVNAAPGAVNAAGLTAADVGFNTVSTNLDQNLRSSFILGQQNDTQLLRRIFQLTT